MLDTRAYLRQQRDAQKASQDENMIEASSKTLKGSLKSLNTNTTNTTSLRSAFGDLGNKIANNTAKQSTLIPKPAKKSRW